MKTDIIIRSDIKASLTKSGLLLFISGFIILMGIITGEIFYPRDFNTRDNYISELAATLPPDIIVPQPSASIFNIAMIVAGILIIGSTYFVQIVFRKLLASIPIGLFGVGITGVGIFPGNIVPWHGIFALIVFLSGGIAAITSFKIVCSPFRYIFSFFGILALVLLFFPKIFIHVLGVGGAERWLFYPLVFWITGLGAYLLGIKDGHKNTLSAKA